VTKINAEVLLITYILGMVLTFGHAFHQTPDEEIGRFGGVEYTIRNGPGTKAIGGMLCAIVWPLYWSARIWK
jgi:hypothetical protein